jgi:hypothetical protein
MHGCPAPFASQHRPQVAAIVGWHELWCASCG